MKNHLSELEQSLLERIKSMEGHVGKVAEATESSERRRQKESKALLMRFQNELSKTAKPAQAEFESLLEELHKLVDEMNGKEREERQAWQQVFSELRRESKSYFQAARGHLENAEKVLEESSGVLQHANQQIENQNVQIESFKKTLEHLLKHQEQWEDRALETEASQKYIINSLSKLIEFAKVR